ncbi:MAG: AbiV family abortive infection protein [Nitrososphaera sp.]|jgi:AbiV family abortive infection protein
MNLYQYECLLNASSLLKASKLLFNNKMYGHSASLAVLAIEECGKGVIMIKDPKTSEIDDHLVKDIRSHKTKLDFASYTAYVVGLTLSGFFNKDQPVTLEEFQNRVHDYLKKRNKKFIDLAVNSYMIKHLAEIKEQGFYTDFRKNKVSTPRDIKRKTAQYVIKRAIIMIETFSKMH